MQLFELISIVLAGMARISIFCLILLLIGAFENVTASSTCPSRGPSLNCPLYSFPIDTYYKCVLACSDSGDKEWFAVSSDQPCPFTSFPPRCFTPTSDLSITSCPYPTCQTSGSSLQRIKIMHLDFEPSGTVCEGVCGPGSTYDVEGSFSQPFTCSGEFTCPIYTYGNGIERTGIIVLSGNSTNSTSTAVGIGFPAPPGYQISSVRVISVGREYGDALEHRQGSAVDIMRTVLKISVSNGVGALLAVAFGAALVGGGVATVPAAAFVVSFEFLWVKGEGGVRLSPNVTLANFTSLESSLYPDWDYVMITVDNSTEVPSILQISVEDNGFPDDFFDISYKSSFVFVEELRKVSLPVFIITLVVFGGFCLLFYACIPPSLLLTCCGLPCLLSTLCGAVLFFHSFLFFTIADYYGSDTVHLAAAFTITAACVVLCCSCIASFLCGPGTILCCSGALSILCGLVLFSSQFIDVSSLYLDILAIMIK